MGEHEGRIERIREAVLKSTTGVVPDMEGWVDTLSSLVIIVEVINIIDKASPSLSRTDIISMITNEVMKAETPKGSVDAALVKGFELLGNRFEDMVLNRFKQPEFH